MTRRFETAEALAYVDNCLAPADRQAFEARLREDGGLRRQVALWQFQNKAIRAAYGAASPRPPINIVRSANENLADATTWAIRARPSAAGRPGSGLAHAALPVASAPRRVALRRGAAIAALAATLVVLSASGGPTPPQSKLIDAGLAAYRAFAAASDAPVEFPTRDPRALTAWLRPQFVRGVDAPRFSSTALTLLGARIAPGTRASAAFLVYEDRRGERVGLLIEPLDAPAASKPTVRRSDGINLAAWTGAGHGFVAVGADPDEVALLTRLVEDSPAPR